MSVQPFNTPDAERFLEAIQRDNSYRVVAVEEEPSCNPSFRRVFTVYGLDERSGRSIDPEIYRESARLRTAMAEDAAAYSFYASIAKETLGVTVTIHLRQVRRTEWTGYVPPVTPLFDREAWEKNNATV
jgi:hypothetical protein